jgi:hypothetical protein
MSQRNRTQLNVTPRSPKRRGPWSSTVLWVLLGISCLSVPASFAQVQDPPSRRADPTLFEPVNPGLPQQPPVPVPAPFQCPSWQTTAGAPDNFQAGNVETASPSTILKNVLAGSTLVDFDNPLSNRGFAHTFQLPRCGCIVGAKLEFRAKAHSDIPENDALTLGFSDQPTFPRWTAYFGTGNTAGFPMLTSGSWTASTPATDISLDLGALAPSSGTTSLLSAMQTYRYLDVYVQDDTSIDYLRLTYTACNCDCQPCAKVEVCVNKFNDKNRNGKRDAGEPALAGWTFQAKDQNGLVISFPATNSDGRSCVSLPAPATYTISEVPKAGWVQSTPSNPADPVVTVAPGATTPNLLFGNSPTKVPIDPHLPNDPH